jgi:hypothetical protein
MGGQAGSLESRKSRRQGGRKAGRHVGREAEMLEDRKAGREEGREAVESGSGGKKGVSRSGWVGVTGRRRWFS